MEEKKDVITKPTGAVAPLGSQVKGLEEGIDNEEMQVPRVKLLQGLSPEVTDDRENKFRAGMIINSITKEMLPAEFIPVLKFTEWIRFNPRKKDDANFDPAYDPGALIWRSRNPDDQRVIEEAKFGKEGQRPAATRFMNFLSYFPGSPTPIVVSFCNSSFNAGKSLLNMARYSGKPAIYHRKYKLFSDIKKNDKGTFYVFKVGLAGEASADEIKIGETWHNDLSNMLSRIETHQEEDASDDAGSSEKAPY